jgi:hypothetical protein
MKNESNKLPTVHLKKNDELYTPEILVKPILKYLKPNSIVWCPFDTENSEFVICLRKTGHNVLYSHIWSGQDFFNYEPDKHYDYIISNPPFSLKLKVLDRLYELNKPFGVLFGLTILNHQEIGDFFLDKKLQLLIVDKKVSFNGHTSSFNTSYFCNHLLPRDLIFEHLENNNSNKYFIMSSMLKESRLRKIKEILRRLDLNKVKNSIQLDGVETHPAKHVKGTSIIDFYNEFHQSA